MVEKVVLYLLNCALFNPFFVYRTLNTNRKVNYKNFLHEVGRSWISEVQNQSESNYDDLQLPEKQTTPRGPKQDPPGRLRWFQNTQTWKSCWWWGGEKRSILQDNLKCVLHIRSEVKLDTFEILRCSASQRVLFWEIPFSDELLGYLHAVSEVWGSGA